MEKFNYKTLFKDCQWALHTTMTCDVAFTHALRQYCSDTAVFYHAPRQPVCSVVPVDCDLGELKSIHYPVNLDGPVFHAKLSLVKKKQNDGYRLAVYTRNMVFGSLKEAWVILELNETHEPSDTGPQLQQFLKKLYGSTDDAGKLWMEHHKLDPDGQAYSELGKCTARAFDRDAIVCFGGCGGYPLFQHMISYVMFRLPSVQTLPCQSQLPWFPYHESHR